MKDSTEILIQEVDYWGQAIHSVLHDVLDTLKQIEWHTRETKDSVDAMYYRSE